MSDDVLGNVREAFQGRRGKILIIGGGLAVAAYVVWFRRGGGETLTEEDLTDVEGSSTSGGTGRIPQTDPEVGNTSTGTVKGRPTTNIAWLADATDFLIGRGVAAAAAYSALSKALNGEQLTTSERAWVSQAITGIGVPPEGMPPLQSAPATGGGTSTPKPTAPKPTPPKPSAPKPTTAKYAAVTVVKYTSKSPKWNSTLSGIARHYGKSWPAIWNDAKNKALRTKRKSPSKIQPGDVVYVRTN